jgi:hypothetical protein
VFTGCDDDDTDSTTTKTDNCAIANGNFEYYTDDDELKLIVSPSSWTKSVDSLLGSSASASTMESGIINTEQNHWTSMTTSAKPFDFEKYKKTSGDDTYYDVKAAFAAAKKVWTDMSIYDRLKFYEQAEDALDDYNDVKDASLAMTDFYYYSDYTYTVDWDDVPGTEYEDADTEKTFTNPGTHNGFAVYDEATDTYSWVDKDGKAVTCDTSAEESGVLMINNYRTDGNGTAQKYTSSTTVTLEPGKAAELSVWVKTQNLTYANGQDVIANRGAFIGVTNSVGGQALDQMQIKNINTESEELKEKAAENNGWVQYTVYLNACPYASSTFTIVLGLGQGSSAQKFEYAQGYAFFDDVELTIKAATDYDFEEQFGKDYDLISCDINTEGDDKTFAVDTETYSGHYEYLLNLYDTRDNEWNLTGANQNVNWDIDLTYTELNGKKYSVASGKNGDYVVYKTLGEGFDLSKDIAEFTTYTELEKQAATNEYLNKVWNDDFAENFPFDDDMKSSDMLILFSASGAPYTVTFKSLSNTDYNNGFLVKPDEYYMLSFWLKTSDTTGFTGANVTLYDAQSQSSTALGAVNTTTLATVDIDEREDIYDGWVQCFFFIANETEFDQYYYLQFTYGTTTITDTDKYSYGEGYAVFMDFQYIPISSFEYAYAGSTTESASASLTGLVSSATGFASIATMDEENIKTNMVNSSAYYGVYGGGVYTTNTLKDPDVDDDEYSKYDKINANNYAGILDKNYFATYWANKDEEGYEWLKEVAESTGVTNAINAWKTIFGDACSSRPLLIYNAVAESYGYIASSYSTLSTNGYNAISVRVKVSAGAKAYIYLINMDDPFADDFNKANTLSTIGVTYWYDDNGNICDSDPADDDFREKTNTVFYLNDNGLYTVNPDSAWAKANNETNTSVYYANLTNYTVDEATKNLLVNTDSEGKPVITYEYSDDYTDDGIAYYYKDGAYYADEDYKVKVSNLPAAFTASYARYINVNMLDENGKLDGVALGDNVYVTGKVTNTLGGQGVQSCIIVDGTKDGVAGKWVTVSFYVKTGDESMPYRLEVFSGSRDGSVTNPVGSYVVFDECNSPDLSSNYDDLLSDAIDDLTSNGLTKDPDTGRLLKDGNAYDGADYYCYTFYDDPDYQRYDADLDEDDIGNPYTGYLQSSYEETLTYLYYEKTVSTNEISYSMFLDYSPLYQTVDADDSITSDDDDEDNWWEDSDFWLMLSSIILAVVLIVVIISMGITKLVRDARRKSSAMSENRYDAKRKRYIKRLNLQTEEDEEEPSDPSNPAAPAETGKTEPQTDEVEDPYQD